MRAKRTILNFGVVGACVLAVGMPTLRAEVVAYSTLDPAPTFITFTGLFPGMTVTGEHQRLAIPFIATASGGITAIDASVFVNQTLAGDLSWELWSTGSTGQPDQLLGAMLAQSLPERTPPTPVATARSIGDGSILLSASTSYFLVLRRESFTTRVNWTASDVPTQGSQWRQNSASPNWGVSAFFKQPRFAITVPAPAALPAVSTVCMLAMVLARRRRPSAASPCR